MIIIRKEQMAAFEAASVRRFEGDMIAHWHRFFPAYLRGLDEETMRAAIAHGVERAAAHGLIAEQDACLYLDVMLLFGRDFDRDPRRGWAAQILAEARLAKPRLKARVLFEEAMSRRARAVGLTGEEDAS